MRVIIIRHARDFGVEVVERRNGVRIDRREYDLDHDAPREHFSTRHEERSRAFVETILMESTSEDLEDVSDRGWNAFVETLE